MSGRSVPPVDGPDDGVEAEAEVEVEVEVDEDDDEDVPELEVSAMSSSRGYEGVELEPNVNVEEKVARVVVVVVVVVVGGCIILKPVFLFLASPQLDKDTAEVGLEQIIDDRGEGGGESQEVDSIHSFSESRAPDDACLGSHFGQSTYLSEEPDVQFQRREPDHEVQALVEQAFTSKRYIASPYDCDKQKRGNSHFCFRLGGRRGPRSRRRLTTYDAHADLIIPSLYLGRCEDYQDMQGEQDAQAQAATGTENTGGNAAQRSAVPSI
ncbi:hypothetical protein CHU98_g3083 [Xylaria longipes]|nr:hypothetical protein CHU98_g3083 [Xylaria longipes]